MTRPALPTPARAHTQLLRPALGWVVAWVVVGVLAPTCHANPDAKRLYDDLLSSYNRLIRPVQNNTDKITVWMRLRLSQLIDLNLKEQIMTTNVWVHHEWRDHKFQWDPDEYGGVEELYVPSEIIWLPDIVLYNNADGEYIITTMTKAVLHFDGTVKWSPPAIFKSSCVIDVRYFPFDQQECFMKFGSWTYDGYQIDLKHLDQHEGTDLVKLGIDLAEYYPSVEWDIMGVPAQRNEKFYPCCVEPYPDIYFNITLRRKTLFYTVNLIIPCVSLEYLSVLVFYLPAYSGEKVALCISILLSQTMFFLLISEIMPSTSLAMPLLGKYLLFTMLLVGLSVIVTIIVLNIHYRKPSTHRLAPWVRKIFMDMLPPMLLMRVPKKEESKGSVHELPCSRPRENGSSTNLRERFRDRPHHFPGSSHNGFRPPGGGGGGCLPVGIRMGSLSGLGPACGAGVDEDGLGPSSPGIAGSSGMFEVPYGDLPECFHISPEAQAHYPVEIQRAIQNVKFIHHHQMQQDKFDEEDDDWAFVAMVLDRLLLWIFGFTSVLGTIIILFESPFLYDSTSPIDMLYSKVGQQMFQQDVTDL
ncbi:acetylcholine receptor subunit alpha-L1-like [Portunus trituberculatus]|uniref:acetylcholine receptor subunit alpha-L1-like n=1 Tax=Portunus trituberculatus TaxID=210409 RepID=UPI001E1CD61A|nr:acetylcholine receptor subunit alpha-L1-like [Portunus trituberculatus]